MALIARHNKWNYKDSHIKEESDAVVLSASASLNAFRCEAPLACIPIMSGGILANAERTFDLDIVV